MLPLFAARGTSLAIVTNDLVTREDAERLQRSGLIPPERVVGVEAGACPHTVIREDPTLNIEAADLLEEQLRPLDLILIESGGDNLASTFSLDLVDYWLFVIDVSGGGDISAQAGARNHPGRPAHHQQVRAGRPVLVTNCRTGEGLDRVADHLAHDVLMEG
ncbi:Urease accessory protein UreG 2 [Geodia barretti]|uniref:Urease accessory protein UreG 2 n=1 Tax=Geodia barretti TaxID=519541 RepID=A0AA35RCL3_GEOBA|nr:Urease accessory protein UreG 2 [Geodia barretti]